MAFQDKVGSTGGVPGVLGVLGLYAGDREGLRAGEVGEGGGQRGSGPW